MGWRPSRTGSAPWDAENRLVRVRPVAGTEADGVSKVEFEYDSGWRRVRKTVTPWDEQASGWAGTPSLDRRFLWSGWRMLLEFDILAAEPDEPLRALSWGLDLAGLGGSQGGRASAGLFERAGTIGGLLAVRVCDVSGAPEPDDPVAYVYLYDSLGNVGQVVDWSKPFGQASAAIVAHYEYDPYGGVTKAEGAYASDNAWRFSTKQWDDETGLGWWGFRYYDAVIGRWMSRDPIGEHGGRHLYGFVAGRPVTTFDPTGLAPRSVSLEPQMSSRNGDAWILIADSGCTRNIDIIIDGQFVTSFSTSEVTPKVGAEQLYAKRFNLTRLRESGSLTVRWSDHGSRLNQSMTLSYSAEDKMHEFAPFGNVTYTLAEKVGLSRYQSELRVGFRQWDAVGSAFSVSGPGVPGGSFQMDNVFTLFNERHRLPAMRFGPFARFTSPAVVRSLFVTNHTVETAFYSILDVASAYGDASGESESKAHVVERGAELVAPGRSYTSRLDSVLHAVEAQVSHHAVNGKWFNPIGSTSWSVTHLAQGGVMTYAELGWSRTPAIPRQISLPLPGSPLPESLPSPPPGAIVVP
ncbi:MAG: RHS repeat-associated core domain-containing protein [Phycisphaerales bacterium]|nr:RHS repeat-associated core domain-containing protein [Phycisphaerales bacterium]